MVGCGYAKFLVFGLLLLLCFAGGSCGGWTEKPGKGLRAEQGFALAFPVTEALENYRSDNGKYPQNLSELVPKYIDQNPQQNEGGEVKFIYVPDAQGKSYRLRFTYEVPLGGTDECSFTPEDKKWICGGKL